MRDVLKIETERLTLRGLGDADCQRIAALLGDYDVAKMLSSVPWPYPPIAAQGWLMLLRARAPLNDAMVFGIDVASEGLVGVIGLHRRENGRLSVGYWIGRPFWKRGYASEALQTLVAEAQSQGDIYAEHFVDNPASGRVLEKAGFVPTGGVELAFSMALGRKALSRAYIRRALAPAEGVKEVAACA